MATPAPVAIYAGDVRDADALSGAARDFMARFGVPDIVIANAGISRGALTDEPGDLPAFLAAAAAITAVGTAERNELLAPEAQAAAAAVAGGDVDGGFVNELHGSQ